MKISDKECNVLMEKLMKKYRFEGSASEFEQDEYYIEFHKKRFLRL
ncbi:MAG: hypothetical protein H5T41_02715 [Methanomassiliicoccales archaeon]|nr:hypothetical protein [Methanomassiliicoccales archaeon]